MSHKQNKEIENATIESLRDGVRVQSGMHAKAGEVIEMMKVIRTDSLKRKRQYQKMVKAGELGNFKEVARLFSEMKTWRKYKINL